MIKWGVHYSYDYCASYWVGIDGKKKVKLFSVAKCGKQQAFTLACEYRAKMLAELNEQGAGYSETHGQ